MKIFYSATLFFLAACAFLACCFSSLMLHQCTPDMAQVKNVILTAAILYMAISSGLFLTAQRIASNHRIRWIEYVTVTILIVSSIVTILAIGFQVSSLYASQSYQVPPDWLGLMYHGGLTITAFSLVFMLINPQKK